MVSVSMRGDTIMPSRRFRSASIVAAILILAGRAQATPEPVTTCGQSIAHSGILTADLDCSATTGPAVSLAGGARLDLGGFTLTATDTGVHCAAGTCKVYGPGTIRRPTFENVFTARGVEGFRSARVTNVVFENWPIALYALGPLHVRSCTVSGGGWGTLAERTNILESTFSNNLIGVRGGEGSPSGPQYGIKFIFWGVRVVRSTFTGNGIDIASYKRPSLSQTSCTTSDMLTIPDAPWSGGDEWGVCP